MKAAGQKMCFILKRGIDEPQEFISEMKVCFVVSGVLRVTVSEKEYTLGREDIILLNPGVKCALKAQDADTIVCVAVYPQKMLNELLQNEYPLYICNTAADRSANSESRYRRLRDIFRLELQQEAAVLGKRKKHSVCMELSRLYRILDCLSEDFRSDEADPLQVMTEDIRIIRACQYINGHFGEHINMTELAESFYLSKSTFSRIFKRETGMNFGDFLTEIRIRNAQRELIETDKTVTSIAVDSGFTNASSFARTFGEIAGCTPTEYRETNRQGESAKETEEEPADSEDLKEELEKYSIYEGMGRESRVPTDYESIEVKSSRGTPYKKTWSQLLNLGTADSLANANMQFHAQYLKKELDYTYGRIWSVFSRKMRMSDGRTIGRYNYDRLDTVLDFLVENHIVPFIDLGLRSDTAISTPGKPIYYEADYIVFENRIIWEDLLRDLIIHISNRYGITEVSKWCFEFSNLLLDDEEIPYYISPDYDYIDAFCSAFRIIKSFLPEAQVGGPLNQTSTENNLIKEFLAGTAKEDCRPDFISFMLFPYRNEISEGKHSTELVIGTGYEREEIAEMQRVMDENGAKDCRLYITEWNCTLSSRSYINDSCWRAAYMAYVLSEVSQKVDMIGIWNASDWISSYFDTLEIANGASGLLTKDTIRKPAYYTIDFMNKLGDRLLSSGTHHIITSAGKNEWLIFLFDRIGFNASYYMHGEVIRNPEDVEDQFEEARAASMSIVIRGVEYENYTVRKRTISSEYGSLLDNWKNLLYEAELQSTDINYLRAKCIPEIGIRHVSAAGKSLKIAHKITPNEITLLHIYPKR